MAEKDHLGNEVSVEVSVTENGAKASLKSRLAAAFDRLGGNLVDALNIPLESANVRKRAKSDGERDLIEAVAKYGVQLLGQDPELAKRALETHFGHVVRTQENKDAVLAEALEHLSVATDSPGGDMQSVPPGDLTPEFLDRFERYAAEASTDELRSRWGRVLAREVQTPGAMSNKAMRIVDELDPRTAQLFERVCGQARVGGALIHSLIHDLKLPELLSLDEAGLINYSGGGIIRFFKRSGGDRQLLSIRFGEWVVSLRSDTIPKGNLEEGHAIGRSDDEITTSVIKLTDAGQAVASILPDHSEQILRKFIETLHTLMPDSRLGLFRFETTDISRSYGIFVNGAWTRG
jgi:hypothetical protein